MTLALEELNNLFLELRASACEITFTLLPGMVTVNHATIVFVRFVFFIFLFSVYLTLVAKVHSFLHFGTFLSRRTADPFCNSHN